MSDEQQPPVVVNDKRRINPDGEEPLEVPQEEATVPETAPEPSYLDDLLRLKAEFDNYRKRTERDRVEWGQLAQARLATDLLGVLDDVERARSHGDLDPGFRSVAEGLEKALTGAGLERFGAAGEPFDPSHHEALTHVPSADVEVETVLEVYRAGYTFAGRVLRPAQVVVAGPSPDAAGPSFDTTA